jgi:hypothetical protein
VISEVEASRNMDHICISTGPCQSRAMRSPRPAWRQYCREGIRCAKGDGMSFYICDPSGNQIG